MRVMEWKRKGNEIYIYFEFNPQDEFLGVEGGSFEVIKNSDSSNTLIIKVPAIEKIYRFQYKMPHVPEIINGEIDVQKIRDKLEPIVGYDMTWLFRWFTNEK